jgi:hypothetical protein
MSQDYTYQKIAKWEKMGKVKVPIDQWGHYLAWDDIRGKEARDLTSPYGSLTFAIGTGDDFVCMDYAGLPDGRIVIHAVVNSETGHFIDRFAYEVVENDNAVRVARRITNEALEWHWDEDNPKRLDIAGWNQDPTYFMRCVENHVKGLHKDVPRKIKKWRERL